MDRSLPPLTVTLTKPSNYTAVTSLLGDQREITLHMKAPVL